jgi:hypothetical protein
MRALLVLVVLTVAGCASTHDLSRGPNVWGGGIYREELVPGLHYIVVKSNVAPWTNQDVVGSQWQAEAMRLCGGGYHALRVEDMVDEEHAPMFILGVSVPYLVTVRKGYVLCSSAGISTEDAERMLDKRR